MWNCAECNYLNEDLDDTCLKCGAGHSELEIAAEANEEVISKGGINTVEAMEPETADNAVPASSELKPESKGRPSPVLAVAIALAVIAISAALVVAYQRGMLPGVEKLIADLGRQAPGGSQALAPEKFAYPDVNPSQRRSFTKYEKMLEKTYAGLSGRAFTVGEKGALTVESIELLDILDDLGVYLAGEYTKFETAQAGIQDEGFKPYAEALRGRFLGAMEALLALVGEAYALDFQSTHQAYLLSDKLVAAVDTAGHADGARLQGAWEAAAHRRTQHELDIKYAGYYSELQMRLDELNTVHHVFNEQLAEMPPYTIRSGHLGKDARDLLDLYDALSFEIERMVVGYEENKANLAGLERSDRMDELVMQFESLAKTDHLHCFTETYIIYAQDKQLDHPAYANLEGHFKFAEEHWPYVAGDYRLVYMEYETKWEANWVGR